MLPVFLLLNIFSCYRSIEIVVLTEKDDALQLRTVWENLPIVSQYEARVTIMDVREDEDLGGLFDYLCTHFQPDSSVLIDLFTSCSTANLLAGTFKPYIRPTYRGCHCVHASNILPLHDGVLLTAFEYIKQQRTTLAKIVIIADTCQYSPSVLDKLQIAIPVLIINPRATNITRWLTKLSRDTIRYYGILIGMSNEIEEILCAARGVDLPSTFTWLTSLLDDQDYGSISCLPSHFFKINLHQTYPGTTEYSQILGDIVPSFWLHLYTLLPELNNQSDVINSCHNNSEEVSYENDYKILNTWLKQKDYVIYHQVTSNDTSVLISKWSSTTGYHPEERNFAKNNELLVVTLHEPPFVYIEENENGTVYKGYAIDVFSEIATRLGLNYKIYTVLDGQYGRQDGNGYWTGLVGDIVRGSADIAIAPLSVTTERDQVVDFTGPFYDFAGIQIMMRRPESSTSFMAFTFVFSQTVWITWFMVLLFTIICIYFFERTSPYSPRNSPGVFYTILQKLEKEFNMAECFWFVTASVSFRGPECTPRTLSTRILIAGFWFFSSVMMANYIANFAAVLTTSRLTVQIESLQDLASQSEIKYSLVEGTTIHDYFERMAAVEKNFYELWRNMSYKTSSAVFDYPLGDPFQTIQSSIRKTGFLKTSEEGLYKVLTENFAMIHESPMLQYELSQNCDLITVGKQFSTKYYAFALPQRSVLTKLISKTILDMQSGVVFDSLKEKWWKGNNSKQDCVVVDESDGLTFMTTGGIFLVIVFGMGLGLVVLVLEILYSVVYASKKPRQYIVSEQNSRTDLASDFDVNAPSNNNNRETLNL